VSPPTGNGRRGTEAVMVAVVLSILSGCARNSFIAAGESSWNDSVRVTGGVLFLEQDRPAVLFGSSQPTGEEARFSYFLLVKHGFEDSAANVGRITSEDGMLVERRTFSVEGVSLTLAYRVGAETTGRGSPRETLALAGTEVELEKGRLFLVDLTGSEMAWRQVKIDWPFAVPALSSTAEVRAFAPRAMAALRDRSGEVEDFLR
jgi:hypothetical protein